MTSSGLTTPITKKQLLIGGAVFLVVVLIIVVIAVALGGRSSTTTTTGADALGRGPSTVRLVDAVAALHNYPEEKKDKILYNMKFF